MANNKIMPAMTSKFGHEIRMKPQCRYVAGESMFKVSSGWWTLMATLNSIGPARQGRKSPLGRDFWLRIGTLVARAEHSGASDK